MTGDPDQPESGDPPASAPPPASAAPPAASSAPAAPLPLPATAAPPASSGPINPAILAQILSQMGQPQGSQTGTAQVPPSAGLPGAMFGMPLSMPMPIFPPLPGQAPMPRPPGGFSFPPGTTPFPPMGTNDPAGAAMLAQILNNIMPPTGSVRPLPPLVPRPPRGPLPPGGSSSAPTLLHTGFPFVPLPAALRPAAAGKLPTPSATPSSGPLAVMAAPPTSAPAVAGGEGTAPQKEVPVSSPGAQGGEEESISVSVPARNISPNKVAKAQGGHATNGGSPTEVDFGDFVGMLEETTAAEQASAPQAAVDLTLGAEPPLVAEEQLDTEGGEDVEMRETSPTAEVFSAGGDAPQGRDADREQSTPLRAVKRGADKPKGTDSGPKSKRNRRPSANLEEEMHFAFGLATVLDREAPDKTPASTKQRLMAEDFWDAVREEAGRSASYWSISNTRQVKDHYAIMRKQYVALLTYEVGRSPWVKSYWQLSNPERRQANLGLNLLKGSEPLYAAWGRVLQERDEEVNAVPATVAGLLGMSALGLQPPAASQELPEVSTSLVPEGLAGAPVITPGGVSMTEAARLALAKRPTPGGEAEGGSAAKQGRPDALPASAIDAMAAFLSAIGAPQGAGVSFPPGMGFPLGFPLLPGVPPPPGQASLPAQSDLSLALRNPGVPGPRKRGRPPGRKSTDVLSRAAAVETAPPREHRVVAPATNGFKELPSRPRRNRRSLAIRKAITETFIKPANLILPVFIHDGAEDQPIPSMPGVFRHGYQHGLLKLVEEGQSYGINSVVLFPKTPEHLKTPTGEEAFNDDGLVQRAIRLLKHKFPDLEVYTDVALDPYNSDGHDGIVSDEGVILNDETVEFLCRQAVSQARAGADCVSPSDMMDGRVGAIRAALDTAGFSHVSIMAYTAKYASAFYGPFRDALASAPKAGEGSRTIPKDKKTYQQDPGNYREALREAEMDELEGADIMMVKPGLPYLDVIRLLRDNTTLPVAAYHVSGEYAMLKAAALQGWLDEEAAVMESLLSMRRAGADIILTYYAIQAAKWMAESD